MYLFTMLYLTDYEAEPFKKAKLSTSFIAVVQRKRQFEGLQKSSYVLAIAEA